MTGTRNLLMITISMYIIQITSSYFQTLKRNQIFWNIWWGISATSAYRINVDDKLLNKTVQNMNKKIAVIPVNLSLKILKRLSHGSMIIINGLFLV